MAILVFGAKITDFILKIIVFFFFNLFKSGAFKMLNGVCKKKKLRLISCRVHNSRIIKIDFGRLKRRLKEQAHSQKISIRGANNFGLFSAIFYY